MISNFDEISGTHVRAYSFEDKLKQGNIAEDFLLWTFHQTVKKHESDGFISDLKFNLLGNKHHNSSIELKTDMFISPSIFMERYSKFWTKKFNKWTALDNPSSGGIWQAVEKGSDLMAYFLPQYRVLSFFNSAKLKLEIEHLIETSEVKSKIVTNPSYQSKGYLLPRNWMLKKSLFSINFEDEKIQKKYEVEVNSSKLGSFYRVRGRIFSFPTTKEISDQSWKPYI